MFVSEGEDAPPADPLAPPRGPPPPVPVNEPVHLPRRKKECSQKISMAISQALLERGQSSEVILTTFDEDIPVTGDVGLIHVRIGKLRGEHLRSPGQAPSLKERTSLLIVTAMTDWRWRRL